jgi:hypothetical protein
MGGKNSTHELVLLDQASQALAEASDLGEIKIIRDKADAVRKYAQSASLGLDVQNRAAEVKLRAERQAGKLLGQLMLRGGDRRSKSHHDRLKLDDLGLTANQSKRWQLQARVPEEAFREHVQQTRSEGKELTSAGVMRLAKRLREVGIGDSRKNFRKSPHAMDERHFNGNGNSEAVRIGKWDDRGPSNVLAEIVSELRNHHTVLDGILCPLYSRESQSLRPAELRMLRYLLGETGALLGKLNEMSIASLACTCHADRAAI